MVLVHSAPLRKSEGVPASENPMTLNSKRPTFARTCAANGIFFIAILAVSTGCGSDSTSNNGGTAPKTYGLPTATLNSLTGVKTSVDKPTVGAGAEVKVTCTGIPGDVAIPEPDFEVLPKDSVTRKDATFSATKIGSYKVHCLLHGGATRDQLGVEVKVVAGDAVSVETRVEPAKIKAGEKATVTCSGKDVGGNPIHSTDSKWSVKLDPDAHGDVDKMQIEGRKAGKAKVTCVLKGSKPKDVKTANLEVTPGKPARSTATVDPSEIKAGESAKVTCEIEDNYGNKLSSAKATLDMPADLKVSGDSVTSEKKGEYEIKCKHPDGDVDAKPANLKVNAADPVDWKLVAKIPKKVWTVEDTIVLRGRGTDKYGNETNFLKINMPPKIKGDPKGLSPNPPAPDPPKSYSFVTDGKYTFTGTLVDFPKLGERSLDILCDSEGPKVLISSPARASTLKGTTKIMVKGMVVDDMSAVKSFNINGDDVKVAADGSFTYEMKAVQGSNPIIWKAHDEWDTSSHGVQSFYFSNKWYVVDKKQPAKAHVTTGIGVWLGQAAIDSGKHDHKNPKDLATVAEIVLAGLDWGTLLKGAEQKFNQKVALTTWKGTLGIKNVKMGDKAFNKGYPEVSITVIKGGMNLVAKVHNFSADMVLQGQAITGALKSPFSQTVSASAKSIEIVMDMMLALDKKTGKINSSAKNVSVKIHNLNINVKGLLGVLSNWLLKAAGPFIETIIEAVVKDQVQKQLGAQIGQMLQLLALNQEIELPAFIGDGQPTKMLLNSKIGDLQFFPSNAQDGGIIVGLDASMTAEKKVKHTKLGSIGRDGCLDPDKLKNQVFAPGQKFPLELAMADDFINQLLYSLWFGGGLNMNIDEKVIGGNVDLSSFGVSNLNVAMDFHLPPIVNSCLNPKELKLQIGDLKLNAKLKMSDTPVDIDLFITTQATAELKVVKNPKTGDSEIGFALKKIDFLELEVVNINAEAKNLEDLFVNLIKTVMMPKLIESLGSGLGSFPLPAFDLSSFSKDIPKGTKLELAIQKIDNKNGYTYLNGYLK